MYEENQNHVDIIDVDITKNEFVGGNRLYATLTKVVLDGTLECDNDILALIFGGMQWGRK